MTLLHRTVASDRTNANVHPLTIEQQRFIDTICSEFERSWNSDSSVHSIRRTVMHALSSPLLAGTGRRTRKQLLMELLRVEFELQQTLGVVPDLAYYRDQFPGDLEAIEAAFHEYQLSLSLQDAFKPSGQTRYQLQSEIGRGGMGVVYRGYDSLLHRPVAIKVLDPALKDDTRALLRFLQEPRICGDLQHPNIIPIYDTGSTADGLPFYVMKLIRGRTLAQRLKSSAFNDNRDVILDIFQQICHAIASAHRQDVVHRDIKPANVMVADLGEVYVMDWGLAGHVGNKNLSIDDACERIESDFRGTHSSPEMSLTYNGQVFGTPRYMAPEVASPDSNKSSTQLDVYSLGAMLCELLLGKTPKQLSEEPSDVETNLNDLLIEADIDAELADLICACVCTDPNSRPASAEVVVEMLEHYRSDVRARMRTAELEAQATRVEMRLARMRSRIIGVIAICAMLLAGFAARSYLQAEREYDDRRADAIRAFEQAKNAIGLAERTSDWNASDWHIAERSLTAARLVVGRHDDPQLKSKIRLLDAQLKSVPKFRNAATLSHDLEKNRFFYENREQWLFAGMRDLGIARETPHDEVMVRLGQLSKDFQSMLADLLLSTQGSSELKHPDFWNPIAISLEEQVYQTSVARAIVKDDLNALLKFADDPHLTSYAASVLSILANELWNRGKLVEAEKVFRAAKLAYPMSFLISLDFGNFLTIEHSEAPQRALPHLAAAASIDPNAGSMFNYGVCLYECAQYESAREVLEDLVARYPDYRMGVLYLAQCRKAMGDIEGAVSILKELERKGQAEESHYRILAECCIEVGRWKCVEECLYKLLKKSPNDIQTLAFAQSCFAGIGRLKESINCGMKAISIAPKDAVLLYNLGVVYEDSGDIDTALKYYNEALSINPEYAEALINIGNCMRSQGRFDEALPYYTRGHQFGSTQDDWNHPSMHWIRTTEMAIRYLEDLDYHVEAFSKSEDVEEIRDFCIDVLLLAGRYRDVIKMAAPISEPDQLGYADRGLFLEAANAAAKVINENANSSDVDDADWTTDNQQVVDKMVHFLDLTRVKFMSDVSDESRLMTRIYQFRMLSESSRFCFLSDDSIYCSLTDEQGSKLRDAIERFRQAHQSLEARLQ